MKYDFWKYSSVAVVVVLAGGCGVKSTLPPGVGASPQPLPAPVVVPAESEPVQGETPTDEKQQTAAIEVTLTADKETYRRGETVNFTINAKNTSKKSQTLSLPSGQTFDIEARAAGKTDVVWRWSHGKFFTLMVTDVVIRPGASLTYTAIWDQMDNRRFLVPRGEYEITGILTANKGIPSAPVKFMLGN
jgi:hypothetical protein